MALHLHDTLTRSLRPVVPLEDDRVRLYTCGPTVYNRAHIGNFRAYTFEDVLRRALEQRFARVTHVMNITDVEDKIIRNATAHRHSLDEETRPWIDGFFHDLDALGIRRAHEYPRATAYIEPMVELIERLRERGHTYESDGSIYFRIASFAEYGRLSGATPAASLMAGASGRVDVDEYDKEDARDFALWKAVGPDDIGWDTRLGRGRPGWHIECSAMSMSLLGESFEIHCGGVDNIFPHHENEIAQSEAATGVRFVSIWCHNAHLRVDDEKMAKSKGNFLTLQQVLEEERQRPSAVRYLLAASAHYRKPLNYTGEALSGAAEAVDRIAALRDRLLALRPRRGGEGDIAGLEVAARGREGFDAAMDDDLNLPEAMGAFFVAVREANRLLDAGDVDLVTRDALLGLVDRVDDILGVLPLVDREREETLTDDDRADLAERAAARERRDWATSDAIRARLLERGIAVEDTPTGQRWRRA